MSAHSAIVTGAKIPTKACVRSHIVVERQGIVWVWPGEPEAADLERILQ
jgi:phenylpropionate dioxygenase-like ring-hydroxylating dioxygenase large terminal subunit